MKNILTPPLRLLSHPKLPMWLHALAIVAVVALATWLRLRAVALLPPDYDEDDYLKAGQQYADAMRDGDWQRFTELNYRPEHPPLSKIIYGFAILPLPETEELPDLSTTAPPSRLPRSHQTAARLASAMSGILQALLLALIDPLGGLMIAIHTYTIKYQSQIMLEGLPSFTSALAALAYHRSKVREHGRLNGWIAVSALGLGLTASSKYTYCLVGIAILIDWVWSLRQHRQPILKRAGPVWLWGLISLAVFLATDPYLWPDPIQRLSSSLLYHGDYAQSEAVRQAGFPVWQPLVWLAGSVSWHPGVFIFSLDLFISLLAMAGFRDLWREQRVNAIWLIIGLVFLLVWPTKWPQYILMITPPLALSAGLGLAQHIWQPTLEYIRRLRRSGMAIPAPTDRQAYGQVFRKAVPWLLPGMLVITAITFYPLLYQIALALTDVNSVSLRDAMHGGVWRAVMEGLSGREEPLLATIFEMPGRQEVHYVGMALFDEIFNNAADLLVFELIWTVLSVGLQLSLGVAVALILNHPDVRFKKFWITLFVIPWALPEFVGALSWLQIFDPRSGWFALYSQQLPRDVIVSGVAAWRENSLLALGIMLLVGVWVGWPLMMLAATAGLKMIPAEAEDAARVDGANAWQRFRYVIWPMLLPLLAPVIILRVIYAFNQFYIFYVLAPPFPLITAATLAYLLANPSFFGGWYGAVAALSTATVMVLVLLLAWFNRATRAGEGVTYA